VKSEIMDGDAVVACVVVMCLAALDITALLKNVDGAMLGVTISAISGIIVWLQRRRYKRRK